MHGLYKQFKRYEHGKLLWKKHYPDYPLPSVGQRRAELWKAVAAVIVTLPGNLKKYMQSRMDIVDLASYGTFDNTDNINYNAVSIMTVI